ncbi:hypothetical protein SAMN04488522_108279 [Pedobacter caeni]|uniref:Uncharacterized protein n=2 Tax=Pedobacter caeni TaxID=288992 RepID=A0A1M5NV69_9SPHI|nr:hypothetical protein SAMN04488522_108279 [Pedobacter caeni]
MEELLNCFEQVKNKGDIALIKFDGQRNEDEYTVLIAFPEIKKREMIRADESSLRIALIKVLTEYVEGDR